MDEYPTLPEQSIGGWVYERAYLNFRHPPAEGLSGESLDKYFEETMSELEEALEDALRPTRSDELCYYYAVELFVGYNRHGLPVSGGWYEQDSFDMYVLQCMITAQERAEREIRASEARMRAQERANVDEKVAGAEDQVADYDTSAYDPSIGV